MNLSQNLSSKVVSAWGSWSIINLINMSKTKDFKFNSSPIIFIGNQIVYSRNYGIIPLVFCLNHNHFPCLKAQVIIRIWSKHTWNDLPVSLVTIWLHLLISHDQVSSTFDLQNFPHQKAWVITGFGQNVCEIISSFDYTYYFHIIRSVWKSTFDLHDFIRNLINSLS